MNIVQRDIERGGLMTETEIKILKLASQICWMHGSFAGNRVCQDWSGDTDVISLFTEEEKNELYKSYEEFNSSGEDYSEGDHNFNDEMCVSFYIAKALDDMAEKGISK